MAPPIRRVQPIMPPVGMAKPPAPKPATAEQPPAEQPPAEQPPAEQPPAEQPPAEQPPAMHAHDGSPFHTIGREIAVQSVRYHAAGLTKILGLDDAVIRDVLAQVVGEYDAEG